MTGPKYSGTSTIERPNERGKAKAEQRERLAAALRANLKRRKAARSTDQDTPPDPAEAAAPPAIDRT